MIPPITAPGVPDSEARRLASIGRMFAEQIEYGLVDETFPWTLIEHYYRAGKHAEGMIMNEALQRHAESFVTHAELVDAGWLMATGRFLPANDEMRSILALWY